MAFTVDHPKKIIPQKALKSDFSLFNQNSPEVEVSDIKFVWKTRVHDIHT